jgi:hypothetical protein
MIGRRRIDTACTVMVEHTAESLSAHVELDGDLAIGPGDRVRVHGAPVSVPFGRSIRVRRFATLERATPLERAWTRLCARFEFGELYDVSFSPRRSL